MSVPLKAVNAHVLGMLLRLSSEITRPGGISSVYNAIKESVFTTTWAIQIRAVFISMCRKYTRKRRHGFRQHLPGKGRSKTFKLLASEAPAQAHLICFMRAIKLRWTVWTFLGRYSMRSQTSRQLLRNGANSSLGSRQATLANRKRRCSRLCRCSSSPRLEPTRWALVGVLGLSRSNQVQELYNSPESNPSNICEPILPHRPVAYGLPRPAGWGTTGSSPLAYYRLRRQIRQEGLHVLRHATQ